MMTIADVGHFRCENVKFPGWAGRWECTEKCRGSRQRDNPDDILRLLASGHCRQR